ncbi:MAG: hypothetical protein ACKO2P_19435 [Planctomycetota bacterium]
MTQVVASTGARLHFGLILCRPSEGWEFGGAGLMISQPGWRFRVAFRAAGDAAARPEDVPDLISGGSVETTDRITQLLRRLRQFHAVQPLCVAVEAEIPPHTGLGSGTQLSLAFTAAVSWLVTGRLPPAAEQLAAVSGRSERSAIGTAGFDHGGFLVDRGRSATSPRVERYPLPDHWRFLLVRPLHTQGLSGAAEQTWFQGRREMSVELSGQLASLIEHQLVPAITTGDASWFAEALETYGDAAGGFYAVAQGGTFSHSAVRRLVTDLRRDGVRGAAQSSWGPGICIPVASAAVASELLHAIPEEIDGCPLEATISEPLNTGAAISRPCPPESRSVFA